MDQNHEKDNQNYSSTSKVKFAQHSTCYIGIPPSLYQHLSAKSLLSQNPQKSSFKSIQIDEINSEVEEPIQNVSQNIVDNQINSYSEVTFGKKHSNSVILILLSLVSLLTFCIFSKFW